VPMAGHAGQANAANSRCSHQLDCSRTHALATLARQVRQHEAAPKTEFPSPSSQEKGCNTKAMRMPFSDWFQDIAASLKGELLPRFDELSCKLDNHMEMVNKLFLQQNMENNGCINDGQTSEKLCTVAQSAEQLTNHPTLSNLAWEEPDRQVRPQSPQSPLAVPEMCFRNSQEVLCQSTCQETPATSTVLTSSDTSGVDLPKAKSRQFRKSVEEKWMSGKILKASEELHHLKKPTSWRKKIAQRIGVSDSQLSGTSDSFLMRLVCNSVFISFWTFMIVFDGVSNTVFADLAIIAALKVPPDPPHQPPPGYDLTLATLFLVEIGLRVGAWKWAFVLGERWIENIMEAGIVLFTFVMDVANLTNNDFMKLARLLRLGRVVGSIMRSKRLMSLRFMLISMVNCGATLFWACIVIFIVLSFFAVMFMQVAANWLNTHEPRTPEEKAQLQQVTEAMRQHYNGFARSMVSLFMAVTGGSDWNDLYQPLQHFDPLLGFAFLCYICLMVLGVFNVLVGICADRAFAASRSQPDFLAQEEQRQQLAFMHEVKDTFAEMDEAGNGIITREEFLRCHDNSRVYSFFKSHQMHMMEPSWLFSMLDKDGSGSLTLSELAFGLLRLSGQARSSDMMLLVTLNMELRDEIGKLTAVQGTGSDSRGMDISTRSAKSNTALE